MTTWPLQGRPVWAELLTTDPAAAKTFYAAVIGWTYKQFPGAKQPYDIAHRPDGAPMGGVMALPRGMNVPPHWEMYIAVDDIDATIAQVTSLGGLSMSGVNDLPGVGRLSTLTDPQGAIFAVVQPAEVASEEMPPVDGDVAWRELYTTDVLAAKRFYQQIFGWADTAEHDMGPMGKYYMFGRAEGLGGMMNKTPDMAQLPTAWGLYFSVPDVDAAAGRVKASGGQVLNGPMDVPGGSRIANCVDPQGATFSLHHRP
jgi:predicted enzyme related to lactoylglutathione lyase